ncbi:sensor histidine kinase [Burkholderia plantarii]|uniref:sensor histidine kinase n=1 Tax=Burkholderia plantarii TaxID=41899 RepID=UPI0018DD907B|nr:HAMP domain-containing sensor histidine kinase [Burkholderia plantarii]MBI0329695.1 HAMP domain-containing histidine kinase [Burkholderia plantarii]
MKAPAEPTGGQPGRPALGPWLQTLSGRLWLTNVLGLALSLACLASLVLWVYDSNPERALGHMEQMESANDVVRGLRFDANGAPAAVHLTERETWLYQIAPTELHYRVFDANGTIVAASGTHALDRGWQPAPLDTMPDGYRRTEIEGRPFIVATLRVPCGGRTCFVQTATSVQFLVALSGLKMRPIPRVVAVIVVIATLVFGLTLPLTIRYVLRPLREVSAAASNITPRNLQARLPVAAVPSEIRPLIDAFNDALARLEAGFNAQQHFLASAAHELQTPLTLLRGQIELQPEITDQALLIGEIDGMARQVRQLLHLAEVRETQNFSFAPTRIGDVVHDVKAYLARKADARQVALGIDDLDAPRHVLADRSALFILLKNLVENAVNVSPDASVVLIRCTADGLHVIDEGPGIDDAHLPRLFERYWRAPGAGYEGAGLGLAICQEIAQVHGWAISVRSSPTGSCFSLRFAADARTERRETEAAPA